MVGSYGKIETYNTKCIYIYYLRHTEVIHPIINGFDGQ